LAMGCSSQLSDDHPLSSRQRPSDKLVGAGW
jgi:hypothetical protein